MANQTAHIATAPDGSQGAMTDFYLCLEGQHSGPGMKLGRTWRLIDESNGVTCICKSSIPVENELHVRIWINDDQPIEYIFSRDYSTGSLALELTTCLIDGVTYTWGTGLEIPLAWSLREKIEATSLEKEPSSGGRLKFSAIFQKFVEDKVAILNDDPRKKTSAIQIEAKIENVRTGIKVYELHTYFGLGIGLIRVGGHMWAKQFNCHLHEVSDN